jgi:hypothetical protein
MLTSMQTADPEVSGLGSGPASRGVRSALKCIRGVAHVRMVRNKRHVTITYDAFRVCPHQFETAVSIMGCEVEYVAVRTLQAPAVDKLPDAEACAGPVNRSGFRQG